MPGFSELILTVKLKTPFHKATSLCVGSDFSCFAQEKTHNDSELLFLFYQHQLEVAATRELSWLNMGN
jgi:hypothetical protein